MIRTHLYVFDIDDTLFASDARLLQHPNGDTDFVEFKSASLFYNTARPLVAVKPFIDANLDPDGTVRVLTARHKPDDVRLFEQTFEKHGLPWRPVDFLGDIPGAAHHKKADWVASWLNGWLAYDRLTMYDDSEANLREVALIQRKFPQVEFNLHHVKHPDIVPYRQHLFT